MRLIHSVSLVSAIVIVVVIFGPGRAAEARAIYQGSIELQARVCPAGALRLAAECTQERGPLGVMFSVDAGPPKAMDGAGLVTFDEIIAGDHRVTLTSGPYAERFRTVRAFCSNSIAGIYPGAAVIDASHAPRFQVQLAPRSRLACRLYFIP